MNDNKNRSDAQKRADKAYYERTKGRTKVFSATFTLPEYERIRSTLNNSGIGNADLIRRATLRIEQGDDLRRDYDKDTNTLV